MVYDLESLITNTVKEALERVLKKTSLYEVLFPVPPKVTPTTTTTTTTTTKKKPNECRKINYPKCAYPGCEKNRFARGKGFCGEHYRMYLAGEAKSADEYADGAE